MEEVLVFQMTQLISEIDGPDKGRKSELALNVVGLLFIYLRDLGLSDGEMMKYYKKFNRNGVDS